MENTLFNRKFSLTWREFSPGLCYPAVLWNTLGNLLAISEISPGFVSTWRSVIQTSKWTRQKFGRHAKVLYNKYDNITYLQKRKKKCLQLLFVSSLVLLLCNGRLWKHKISQVFRKIRHWKASVQVVVCLGTEPFIPLEAGTALMPSSSVSGK